MTERKCAACGVNVGAGNKYCPLCGKFISGAPEASKTRYEKVDKTYVKRLIYIEAFRGVSVAAALVCFFINLFTGLFVPNLWSLYVVAAIIFFNFAVLVPIERGAFLWREVFIENVAITSFLIFIDFFSAINMPETRGWSLQWMLPCLLGAETLALTLYNIFSKTDSAASLSAILVCFIFSAIIFIISLVLYNLRSYEVNIWTAVPSLTALLESGFFFFVLAWVKFKSLKKKFHI